MVHKYDTINLQISIILCKQKQNKTKKSLLVYFEKELTCQEKVLCIFEYFYDLSSVLTMQLSEPHAHSRGIPG